MYMSFVELKSYVPTPGTPGAFFWQIAKGAKGVACQLWNNYPKQFTGNSLGTGLIRWGWNSFCADPPTSQPPVYPSAPPYSGGQCTFRYNVEARWQFTQFVNNACSIFFDPASASATNFIGEYWGPIYAVYPGNPKTGLCGGNNGINIDCHGNGNGARSASRITIFKDLFSSSGGAGLLSLTKVTVASSGGEPDNCGNTPSDYPDNPPPSPPINFDIDINDGQDVKPVPFTWDGNFSLPLVFINPDVKVTVDLGGINFEWTGDLVFGNDEKNPFPTKPPEIRPPKARPRGGGGCNSKPGGDGVTEEPPITVDPETPLEVLPPEEKAIEFVQIVVNYIYPNSRGNIPASDPTDSVVFAGYAAWIIKDKPNFTVAPEIPIRRISTLLSVPLWADGVRVRSTNNADMTVTLYTVNVPNDS
jgi:hypothetical protein